MSVDKKDIAKEQEYTKTQEYAETQEGASVHACALRIMEGLSGVDEVLLERSDRKGRNGIKNGRNSIESAGNSIESAGNSIESAGNSIKSAGNSIKKGGNSTKNGGRGRRRKPLWQYGRVWAAVLCMAFLGGMTWEGYQLRNGVDNAMPGAAGSNGSAGGAVQIIVGTCDDGGTGSVENQPAMAAPENGNTNQQNVDTSQGSDNMNQENKNTNQGSENSNQENKNMSQENKDTSQENGNTNQGSGNVNHENSEGSSAGNSVDRNEKTTDGIGCMEGAWPEEADSLFGHVTESCGVPMNTVKLTEEEARNREVLGNYIPREIPDGYQFEGAFWNEDAQTLSIGWSRGMDFILLSLKMAAENCETVDVARSETYNVHYYEIPYGETVPEEYREIFDNPVFAWEDFTPDIVKSRMVSYDDGGDTNTPRGNFDVLLPEGVLIRFNGRGTAEQIWEMFQSMGL